MFEICTIIWRRALHSILSTAIIKVIIMEFAHVVLLILAVAFVAKLAYLWYHKRHHRGAQHHSNHHRR